MSSYTTALPSLSLVLSSSRFILDSGETASRALRATEAALGELLTRAREAHAQAAAGQLGDVVGLATEAGLELQISSYGVEGDWSYGAFPSARLDGMEITNENGTRIEAQGQRYTLDPHEGGDFFPTLPVLEPSIEALHVKATFVGLDAASVEQIAPTFDLDLRIP